MAVKYKVSKFKIKKILLLNTLQGSFLPQWTESLFPTLVKIAVSNMPCVATIQKWWVFTILLLQTIKCFFTCPYWRHFLQFFQQQNCFIFFQVLFVAYFHLAFAYFIDPWDGLVKKEFDILKKWFSRNLSTWTRWSFDTVSYRCREG